MSVSPDNLPEKLLVDLRTALLIHDVLYEVIGNVFAANADQPHNQVRGSFVVNLSFWNG